MSAPTKRPARRKTTAADAPAASVETVAARLLALPQPPGPMPALWRKLDLGRALSRPEKTHLDAALARLQAEGKMVAFDHGGNVFFAWAETLRQRLAPSSPPAATAAVDLLATYRRLVRESGGFPDVKISMLARALGAAAGDLSGRLIGAWRTGDATLSLGDWSLASEEMRASAVELDGEKYLLVRFEE